MSKDKPRESAQDAAKRRLQQEDKLAAEAKRQDSDPFPDVSTWAKEKP